MVRSQCIETAIYALIPDLFYTALLTNFRPNNNKK